MAAQRSRSEARLLLRRRVVEVRRTDGSQVEIHLDASYQPVGMDADDDTAGESKDGSEEGGGSGN